MTAPPVGGEVAVPGLPAGAYYAVRRDRRGFEHITAGESARPRP